MRKLLVLALFILGLIAVACGGSAEPTSGVTPEDQGAVDAPLVAGAFNADIKDFAHQDIKVTVGTTVAWTNRDGVPHTTTEVSDTNIWDSFALQPGQSFSFTFSEAGTFNYFCAIHPTMRATVTVTGQETPTMTPTAETAPTPGTVSAVTIAPPPAAGGGNLEIVDFAHQDLTVAAGTTVSWTNVGDVIHTTTSNDGLWDSDILQSGQTFSFTFDQAGSFPFFCAIHPSMTATITVTGPPGAQTAPAATATPTSAPTLQPTPTATVGPTSTTEAQPTATPPPGGTALPVTVNLDMKNFSHQDATVPAGTTIVWTNGDAVQHTVTSGSPSDPDAGSVFDSGADSSDWVVGGATYSLTFNEAGVFPYYCWIHGASMSGTITVTAAQPAAGATAPTTAPTATAPPPSTATPIPEPAAASSGLTTNASIQNFAHQDLTVQIGTTVVWTNRDGAGHTTTAVQGAWDSGRLGQGQSFSFTFTEAGVFAYRCNIHRAMTAEVTVNN